MAVRAKFVVNTITRSMSLIYDPQSRTSEMREVQSVKLFPVTPAGGGEDHSFWMSTPNGSIELNILNPAAVEQFAAVLGKSVFVDFTPAD